MSSETRLQDDVEAALRSVEDSRTGTNVFEAGLIADIEVEGDSVTVGVD